MAFGQQDSVVPEIVIDVSGIIEQLEDIANSTDAASEIVIDVSGILAVMYSTIKASCEDT